MKRYIYLLVCILGIVPIWAQQSDYYYFYRGERIYLPVDSTRLYVVSEGEFQPQGSSNARTVSYNISNSTKSYVYNNVVPLQKQRSAVIPEVYFSTLEIPKGMVAEEYDTLVEKVKAENNVWQVLPSFIVDGGRMDVTNNFYVKLKSTDDLGKLQEMAIQYRVEIVGNNIYMPLWYTLSCSSTSLTNSIETANLFYSSGIFECCEPELCFYNTLSVVDVPDDDFYDEQWALHNYDYPGVDINIGGAWSMTKGEDIVVAIIDDGIRGSWDFHNKIYHKSFDAKTGALSSTYYGLHGTYCAGIVGATQNNSYGISGVAPNCKLMPISMDFNNGVLMQQAANAVSWAWKNDADVMSCSWGCDEPCEMISEAIDSALTFGRNGKGCVVVFAAGNRNQENLSTDVSFPANSNPNIIVVGAMRPCGERVGDRDSSCCADYRIVWESCYGEELDIVAPGTGITTLTTEQAHYSGVIHNFEGTSAACPHVAGVAALILSVNPNLPVEVVDFIIAKTARKTRTDVYSYQKGGIHRYGTWNEKVGYGLLDATAAVEMAKGTLNTTFVWRQTHYEDADYYFENINIDVKDITADDNDDFHLFKDKNVILRSSVKIKKGAELLIGPRLTE